MWLMLQQPKADDYVVATGKTNSVRRLCEIAFNRLRLDYRNYIRQDISLWRPSEPVELVGNAIKARKKLGWFPKTDFRQLVNMMVDTELKNFRKKR
jgi:GDPmannose 4,6-dehydratase